MKKVKLMMMALMMCLINFMSFGQTDDDTTRVSKQVSYSEMSLGSDKPKGKFDSYLSKDNFIYKVGDTIKINTPSGTNGKFVYVTKVDMIGTIYIVGPEATNTFAIIKNIRVSGTKRSGWKVQFQTKGFTFVDNYFLYIEDCITSGEVKSNGLTSDEALSELKKWKEKLDLGLITQEEFDNKKLELSKFIK